MGQSRDQRIDADPQKDRCQRGAEKARPPNCGYRRLHPALRPAYRPLSARMQVGNALHRLKGRIPGRWEFIYRVGSHMRQAYPLA